MRWIGFVVLQGLIVAGIIGVFYIHQDQVITLKKPPASLAKWYKPENKRQVWLHTMFKLRREMLAVKMYAEAEDSENLNKWASKLDKDYQKISKMVPEWEGRLDTFTMKKLQMNAQGNLFSEVSLSLKDLDKNCQSCHEDYRAVTAMMYRAPDFSGMKIDASPESPGEYKAFMESLSNSVNQIMIGFIDDQDEKSLAAFAKLKHGMTRLGETCVTCHENIRKTYLDAQILQALSNLEQSLKTGELKDKGKALGTLAVMACAECHGTHRVAFDIKQLLENNMNWRDLLRNAH